MRQLFVAILLAGLLISLTGVPTAARQPAVNLSWSAEALFDGIVKYGEWLPVRVTLSNQAGDRTVDVRATVTSSDGRATYVQPVELPAGARKQVDLYVLPNTFSRQLQITVNEETEEPLTSTVDIQPITNQAFLIGIIAHDPDALSVLRTVSIDQHPAGIRTVAFTVDEMPERAAGLASFDVLVLNDVDTSRLSPAQQRSLSTWVQFGGHVILGGGPNAAVTVSGLPPDMLPVTLNGSRSIDELPALTTFGGEPVRIPGPFVVANALPVDGTTLVEQGEIPLVVRREVGQGQVTFVALDLGLSPFGAWAGEKTMWITLLAQTNTSFIDGPPDVSPRQLADERMLSALANLPSLDLPSVRWVVLLLAVYIVLVGPANYLILRRARRLEWAWVTIPAMTLTFGLGAYGVGYGLRGGDVILNKLSIIDVMPDAKTARVRTYAGLFSPTKRAYTLAVDGQPLISSLNPRYNRFGTAGGGDITVIQGQPTRVRDLAVNQWAIQTFVAETVYQKPVRIQVELTYNDGHLTGDVTNAGEMPLRDTVLVLGNDFSRLGEIAAGQTIDVNLETADINLQHGPPLSYVIMQNELNYPGPRGPSRETRMKQQVLDSVFQPGYEVGYTAADAGPVLIGWLDASPQSIQVEGANVQQIETSLVIARLDLHFGEQEVGVPPGFVLPQLVTQAGGVSRCYSGRTPGFVPHEGHIVLEFRLPRELHDVRFDALDLIIDTDGGWGQPPATALYDWKAGTWHELEDARLGSNRIDEPNRFIDATAHAIRVRMTAGDQRGGCLYTNIALEGVRREAKAKE